MLKATIKDIIYGANIETGRFGNELKRQNEFQIEIIINLITGKELKKLVKPETLKNPVKPGDEVTIELVGHGFKIIN